MNDKSSPPKGLLAGMVAEQSEVVSQAAPEVNPNQTVSSFDPNYAEPLSLEDIRKLMIDALPNGSFETTPIDAFKVQHIFNIVCARLAAMERALKPFAHKAVVLANAQMCLAGAGRSDEPAGGTWVNSVTHTKMTADESIFFAACDAYGRARTEADMAEIFQRIQKMVSASEEKAKHVGDGGKVH